MRTGVSPILTAMLLVALAVAMSVGAFTFISSQQEFVIGHTETAQLETVNVTCSPAGVEWWIRNSAEHGASRFVDVLFTENGTINNSLSVQDLQIPSSATNGYSEGQVTIPAALKISQRYTIELSFDKTQLTTTCVTGDAWWNINWNHRRAINTPGLGLHSITLDTETLINQQKMRPDCADIRIIQNGNIQTYNINDATCDTLSTTIEFDASPGTPYIYYGNLAAKDEQDETLTGSPTAATLHPEERITLPG